MQRKRSRQRDNVEVELRDLEARIARIEADQRITLENHDDERARVLARFGFASEAEMRAVLHDARKRAGHS